MSPAPGAAHGRSASAFELGRDASEAEPPGAKRGDLPGELGVLLPAGELEPVRLRVAQDRPALRVEAEAVRGLRGRGDIACRG
jgi:hypothetical protein